jgi:hypothetical protein
MLILTLFFTFTLTFIMLIALILRFLYAYVGDVDFLWCLSQAL